MASKENDLHERNASDMGLINVSEQELTHLTNTKSDISMNDIELQLNNNNE